MNGELKFDGEGFGKSLYSASTIGGALGAGVTAGLNEYSLGARTVDAVDADGNILKNKSGKVIKTTEYTRAQGLNSTQIDNMGKFNSLMGGLSSSAVSFAMDGKATFNILNASDLGIKSNTGLFELTVGKDGISSTIGSGGTNISMGNLMASLNGAKASVKNAHINNTVNKKYEGNMNVANMLRAQYGFGDKVQLDQLDSILKGNTELRFGNTTDGKAQTVDENGKRIVHMNMNQNGDWKMGAIMLGHESYRDGVVCSADEQPSETRAAVKGHTEMTLRMMGDNLYAASMSQLVGSNQNLQMDLIARSLGSDIFNQYVDGVYDSSADYWRMTWGGQLVSDKDGWLKDENGLFINADGTHTEELQDNTLGAEKQESGLLNIINGTSGQKYDTFTEEQKQQVQAIMTAAGMSMNSNGQWNVTLGKELNMYNIMSVAGENIADVVFNQYYNNKVDYDIAQAWQMDLQFSNKAMNKEVPDSLTDKYSNLITQHLTETSTPAALKNKYMWTIYDDNGNGTDLFKIDENNSYLDELIKQTDAGLNSTINNYGCNYMSTIAFPQLLTGNILTPSEIQSIWNESTNNTAISYVSGENNAILPWIDSSNSYVRQPDLIANLTFQKMNRNDLSLIYGWNGNYSSAVQIANKIQVPYQYNDSGHWLVGDLNGKYIYNPANTTGNQIGSNQVYLRKK